MLKIFKNKIKKGNKMLKIKPKFMYDEKDKKIGVVVSSKEFEKILEELEDYSDYQMVIERAAKKQKTYTLEEVRKSLGITK